MNRKDKDYIEHDGHVFDDTHMDDNDIVYSDQRDDANADIGDDIGGGDEKEGG